MRTEVLLAKSLSRDHAEGQPIPHAATVAGHLQEVHGAAAAILRCTADFQLQAVGLPPADWRPKLERLVLLAAALHDLGKINNHFQDMIHDPFGEHRQALRHEWATLLIIDEPAWTAWLRPAVPDDEDWEILRWAIAGHHPKYGRSAPPEIGEGRLCMQLPLDSSDVGEIVSWLQATFNLQDGPPRKKRRLELSFSPGNVTDGLHDWFYDKSEPAFEKFSPEQRRFAAVVQNCLIAADIAGSALPRLNGSEGAAWIESVLGSPLPKAAAYQAIVNLRLEKSSQNGKAELRPFQQAVAASPARVTFVKAGCGTGKTLAAYHWAAMHCDGLGLKVCYPTTNTGTAGFTDYLMDPELADHDVRTNLIHRRREVDFNLLQANEERNEAVARIESLETWRVPVIACTVDTVLGLIQNNKRGMFGWPALAQSGFVFDEIHAYDDKLFDALLHFLSIVRGVPILLMTASLQAGRKRAIQELLSAQGEELAEVAGPEDLEILDRYLPPAKVEKTLRTLLPQVRDAVAAGERVLVVTNTVGQALRIADELADLNPLSYHSRFKYRDRVQRHQAVVEAFGKPSAGGALAVCTQVAEMSLDLSATLLATELAPVPALIQRLGRLNRNAKAGDPPKPFLVAEPAGWDEKYSPLPYEEDELDTARKWLEKLGAGPLKQRDLATMWEAFDPQTPPPRWQSAWIDYGPANPVLELRDGSPNITLLLEGDWERLRKLKDGASQMSGLIAATLPMPIRRNNDWQMKNHFGHPLDFKGVPVARDDSIQYDPLRGATWLDQ